MRTITAPRFTLEPLLATHADEMFAVLSDPAIYEFENSPPASTDRLRQRYARLQRRCSGDGRQRWLNWVIRLPDGPLAGYVQATVFGDHSAYIAYELNSRHWRQGLGGGAVRAVLQSLRDDEQVEQVLAVLKARNFRSLGLLAKLGFNPVPEALARRHRDADDEQVMGLNLLVDADQPRLDDRLPPTQPTPP